MPISVDLDLSNDERAQLAGIIHSDPAKLDESLAAFGAAALEEYVRMFIGQRVLTRGADIREYRLFLLIKGPFANQIPDEQRVSDLFQTTTSQSRSLIRSVMSKYQYELQEAINSSLKSTVAEAAKEADDWTVTINSENIVETLNRVIGSIDGSLPQIEKKRGTVSSYIVRQSSYTRLREHFGLPPVPNP